MRAAHSWIRATAVAALAGLTLFVAMLPAVAGVGVTPMTTAGATDLPNFLGAPARSRPTASAGVPQNPFLAPNPSQLHKDTWMSDTQPQSGPLGRSATVTTTSLGEVRTAPWPFFICGTGGFDRYGRYLTACSNPKQAAVLLLDPVSLAVLASYPIPAPAPGDSSGGLAIGYLYVDNAYRAVIPTPGGNITVIPLAGDREHPAFGAPTVFNVSAALGGASTVFSPVPDWRGRIWFTGRQSGMVGVLDPATGVTRTVKLGTDEGIHNSFAVDHNTAYIATDRKLYRVHAGSDGQPFVKWSAPYLNDGVQKPGQISIGTGTTPTILGRGRYVAIVDNAAQAHINVYRTATKLKSGQSRQICQTAVFPKGQGAVEDSLVGLGKAMVAVNNYGYTIDFATLKSPPSVPGVARVDINADGRGCHRVWNNPTVTAPNAGPALSTGNGLVYTYTRKYDARGLDVWYWTALDFRTGKVRWEQQVGTGSQFDAYWPIPLISPDGGLFMSAYGGVLVMRDNRSSGPSGSD